MKLRRFVSEAKRRWKAKEPLVFKRVLNICLAISATAIAVHTALVGAGANEPEWWTAVYPYLVGIPAGAAAVAKFTRTYDSNGNPVQ